MPRPKLEKCACVLLRYVYVDSLLHTHTHLTDTLANYKYNDVGLMLPQTLLGAPHTASCVVN